MIADYQFDLIRYVQKLIKRKTISTVQFPFPLNRTFRFFFQPVWMVCVCVCVASMWCITVHMRPALSGRRGRGARALLGPEPQQPNETERNVAIYSRTLITSNLPAVINHRAGDRCFSLLSHYRHAADALYIHCGDLDSPFQFHCTETNTGVLFVRHRTNRIFGSIHNKFQHAI